MDVQKLIDSFDLDDLELYDEPFDDGDRYGWIDGVSNGYDEDGNSGWYNPEYYDNINVVMIEKKKDETQARHYVRVGSSTYGFVDDVMEQVPAGFYRPKYDNYNQKAFLEKKDLNLPKLYHLPDNVFETIMNDITHFWESEEKYKAFGNVYKRNLLLYSVAGNGKSSIIFLLAHELITKHNGIVITINSVDDLRSYPICIEKIRQVEKDRKIIVILEDIDAIISVDKTSETFILQMLDGNEQQRNIVCIATTNHMEKLEKSLTNRPSRFNLIYEYKKPNEEVRRFYYTNKLNDSGVDVSKQEIIDQIERLVKASEGFTFDYCKELLELIYVMEYSEDEAINKITKMVKTKGDYKLTDDKPTSIGFNSGDDEETGTKVARGLIQERKIGFC